MQALTKIHKGMLRWCQLCQECQRYADAFFHLRSELHDVSTPLLQTEECRIRLWHMQPRCTRPSSSDLAHLLTLGTSARR